VKYGNNVYPRFPFFHGLLFEDTPQNIAFYTPQNTAFYIPKNTAFIAQEI
jgi:hypothetical protein